MPEIRLYAGDMEEDLKNVSRARLAEQITGGLSITQKMPCPSWGISATRCQLGSLLAQKPGTVCSGCYALKGRYKFPNVQKKLEQRYQGLFNPLWTPAMVHLIRWHCERYFRWFDSGDLQGENHQRNIVTIAEYTHDVMHWLPTREMETVRKVGEFPPNLTVRVSAHQIDGKAPRWPTTSVVSTRDMEGHSCPSRSQGNSCGDCRACWSEEPVIVYTLHRGLRNREASGHERDLSRKKRLQIFEFLRMIDVSLSARQCWNSDGVRTPHARPGIPVGIADHEQDGVPPCGSRRRPESRHA